MLVIEIIYSPLTIINAAIVTVIIIYWSVFTGAWYGWKSINDALKKDQATAIKISIIVAARNEDENLPTLLKCLEVQTYPKSLMEWIFIDDHSFNKLSENKCFNTNIHENLILIDLPDNLSGKKEALLLGAKTSSGEILIFTDADCQPGPAWVENIVNSYSINKPGIIIGLVDYYRGNDFSQKFFRFDLMSLVVTGAGLASLGFPIICNGANLAVQRKVYMDNIKSLKTEIASGDDVFLLHAVKKKKEKQIIVLKDKDSIVYTNPPFNIAEFISQRTRWASKSQGYNDWMTIIVAFLVLSANLAIISGVILSIITGNYLIFLIPFIIKTIADCFILTTGLLFFGGIKDLMLLPLFSLMYPFYFISVLLLSYLKTNIWKGRKIRAHQ